MQESLHLREKEFYVPDLTASFLFVSPSIPNISAFNYTWSVCQPSSDGLKSIKKIRIIHVFNRCFHYLFNVLSLSLPFVRHLMAGNQIFEAFHV